MSDLIKTWDFIRNHEFLWARFFESPFFTEENSKIVRIDVSDYRLDKLPNKEREIMEGAIQQFISAPLEDILREDALDKK